MLSKIQSLPAFGDITIHVRKYSSDVPRNFRVDSLIDINGYLGCDTLINTTCSGIHTNYSGIHTNYSGINTLSSGINTTCSGINTTSTGINTNCSGINTNWSVIDTLCSLIDTNCSGINTNYSGINHKDSDSGMEASTMNSMLPTKDAEYSGTNTKITDTYSGMVIQKNVLDSRYVLIIGWLLLSIFTTICCPNPEQLLIGLKQALLLLTSKIRSLTSKQVKSGWSMNEDQKMSQSLVAHHQLAVATDHRYSRTGSDSAVLKNLGKMYNHKGWRFMAGTLTKMPISTSHIVFRFCHPHTDKSESFTEEELMIRIRDKDSLMDDLESVMSVGTIDLDDIKWNEGASFDDWIPHSEGEDSISVIDTDLDLPHLENWLQGQHEETEETEDEEEEETDQLELDEHAMDERTEGTTHNESEKNDAEDDNGYLGFTQILQVPGEDFRLAEKIKPQRKFVRLAMRDDKEGMYFSPLLGVSVSYAPGTIATPPLPDGEIILGVSQNPTDMPTLLSGQRLISPVLACMPHGTAFSRPIMLQMPLLGSTPETDSVIKVLHSSTDVSEPTDWREVADVDCLVHNGRITLSTYSFCFYCVIEEKVQATQKPRPMVVFLYLRRKKLRDEAGCSMEVTVQLSGKPTGGVPPPLGGKLVIQKVFTLINSRPLTISLHPENTGWQLPNGDNERVLYNADLSATDVYPASCTFQVSSRPTPYYTDTLNFIVNISQCQGQKAELQIYESVDELFPQMAGQPRPLVQGMQTVFSHGQLGSDEETAAASGTNGYQVASASSPALSISSRWGPAAGYYNQDKDANCAADVASMERKSTGLGGNAASLASVTSLASRAETANTIYKNIRTMLPNPGPTTQVWLVPYEICQVIGRNLDFCDNWKDFAKKLECKDISTQIKEYIKEQHPRPQQEGWSPTMVLLGKWLLEQLESGLSREECLQKIRAALMGMDRNDIIELLPPAL